MSLLPKRRDGLLLRIGRWIGGSVLILVGLLLSIPGIPGPGFLLVIFGVFVLMPESRWLQKKFVSLRRRYPRAFAKIERWLPSRMRRRTEHDKPSDHRRAA